MSTKQNPSNYTFNWHAFVWLPATARSTEVISTIVKQIIYLHWPLWEEKCIKKRDYTRTQAMFHIAQTNTAVKIKR